MPSSMDLTHDITEEKLKDIVEQNGQSSDRGPLPNRGASVMDFTAIGPDSENKRAWQESRGIDKSEQVRIKKLSHMRYQHPDLEQISIFLKDFGLDVVKETETQRWYAGYGSDQYVYYARKGEKKYLGGTFEVESHEELEKITKLPDVKLLDGGIRKMDDAPGAGYIVTIEDPDGFPVNFVHGQAPASRETPKPEKLVLNYEEEKPRQRKFQRFDAGPAAVYKLGHFGLVVEHFQEQLDWYTRHFNIIPSDILYVPSGDDKKDRKEVACFAHIDRGLDLVDHHTIFFTSQAPGLTRHVHHCSFEVHDFDTQALGHQWLARRGYKSVWGVGRHILGSQLFDYWWDVTGNMVEHYADGDLVNEDTPLAYGPAGHEGLSVWGPEVPKTFLQ